jgi:prephenate dehydrogenase
MKIFIVGLGLIGASYAEGLTRSGHTVYAYNRSHDVMLMAEEEGIIQKHSHIDQMGDSDLIILALYPKHNIEFIEKYKHLLKPGQLITDVSGTKVWMMNELEQILPKGVNYTSTHPMAGKEVSGYKAKDARIFKQANYIIIKGKKSGSNDETILRKIANDLQFGKITVVDAKTHDELIAFTSQLTHVLAVALMHADTFKETKEATGDSFRDLTRIAKINEVMWSELFHENKQALIDKINHFKDELDHVKDLIESNDKETLQTYLKIAKEKRKTFDVH